MRPEAPGGHLITVLRLEVLPVLGCRKCRSSAAVGAARSLGAFPPRASHAEGGQPRYGKRIDLKVTSRLQAWARGSILAGLVKPQEIGPLWVIAQEYLEISQKA